MLNRLPGGASASVAAVERLVDGAREVAVLDVGTGAGDIPLAFARHGRRRGHWQVTAVERHPQVLGLTAAGRAGADRDVALQSGDARSLPFDDRSFDVAHTSLLLHHFDPASAAAVLRELRRVARRGVVVNDLQRGLPHVAITAATIAVMARNRYTRHDGLVSARRAYTLRERRALLDDAGLVVVWESARWMPRVATAARAR